MFWDQTPSYKEEIRKREYKLTYSIIETVHERIHKNTWYKLNLSDNLWYMIVRDKQNKGANWDVIKENNGTSFVWVTDKYLTLLHLKGAEHAEDFA
jgi:hypothetical protein